MIIILQEGLAKFGYILEPLVGNFRNPIIFWWQVKANI